MAPEPPNQKYEAGVTPGTGPCCPNARIHPADHILDLKSSRGLRPRLTPYPLCLGHMDGQWLAVPLECLAVPLDQPPYPSATVIIPKPPLFIMILE